MDGVNPLPQKEVDGGALNITRATAFGAALVAVLTAWDDAWNKIFGAATPDWAKPVVVMAVIAAFAIVVVADLLGRGYAAGQRGDIIQLPDGLTANYKPDAMSGYVVAVRFRRTKERDSEFLFVSDSNRKTKWADVGELEFTKR